MRRHLGFASRVALVAALVVVAASCDWATFHNGPGRTGYNPFETKIGVGNVASLTTAWTAKVGIAVGGDPVVADGLVYMSAEIAGPNLAGIYAYSATGSANCSGTPKSCAPVWMASALCPTGCHSVIGNDFSDPTVANGVLYVGDTDGVVYAFDAAGVTNCSGTPKVCEPLWTAMTGPPGVTEPPVVVNGVLYVSSADGNLYAFDAAGSTNCSGTPKTCLPLWTAATGRQEATAAAVANGVVYVVAEGVPGTYLEAFDAAGSVNCSGTPKTCLPLWSGALAGSISLVPAVANGVVYVTSSTGLTQGELYAFDAHGVTDCSGTPKACLPLWTATDDAVFLGSPAIAYGNVYLGSDDGKLYAYDAAGTTGCSGTPTTCAPLWTASTGASIFSSPAVANGVVYVGSTDDNFYAFDAHGATDCSGTPRACLPLWTAITGSQVNWSPAVVNGFVYEGSDDGNLYAYSLP